MSDESSSRKRAKDWEFQGLTDGQSTKSNKESLPLGPLDFNASKQKEKQSYQSLKLEQLPQFKSKKELAKEQGVPIEELRGRPDQIKKTTSLPNRLVSGAIDLVGVTILFFALIWISAHWRDPSQGINFFNSIIDNHKLYLSIAGLNTFFDYLIHLGKVEVGLCISTILLLYGAIPTAHRGATLGKILVGARVYTGISSYPGIGLNRAIVREVILKPIFVYSIVLLPITFVFMLFNKDKRCLHDWLSGSIVLER